MPCSCEGQSSPVRCKTGEVCEHLEYLYASTNQKCPKWVSDSAVNHYSPCSCVPLNKVTTMLYDLIRSLTDNQMEAFVYNGRKKQARMVAGWWEDYQEQVKRREKARDRKQKRKDLRERALRKLTVEEMEVLCLKEWDEDDE